MFADEISLKNGEDFWISGLASPGPKVQRSPATTGERRAPARSRGGRSHLPAGPGILRQILSLFVAELEFCRETHFWRQNTQIVSSLGVAVDVSDDNLSPRSFVAMTSVASRDFDDTNIGPLSVVVE